MKKPIFILGISCYYHDASAALLKDGKIVAAAEEERFTRKKHDPSFPINAIKYCLKSENITIDDISYIGFYEKPLLKFERVLFQHLEMFPWSIKTFIGSMPSWINEKLRVIRKIKKELGYRKDVLFIPHHMAHAASAFFVSPFDEAAVLTVDGVGEWASATYGVSKGNDITLMREMRFPHSLGLLYSTITAYLGFSVNNSEYKVMGLSAYGKRRNNPYYKKLRKVIDIKQDGSLGLDMSYFRFHYSDRMPSKKLCLLLGGPVSKKDSKMTERHEDIAAALQMITEEILTKMLNNLHKETGSKNLVFSGGVALNSVFNGKILKNTKFKDVWIQPNASDGGTSIGVACYIYNTILRKKRRYVMENAYLGPCFSEKEIENFLKDNKIKYEKFKSCKQLISRAAKMIYDNKVVGWFNGRMEFGPRALGARSILANPCNPSAKELLNEKVKHRERFRPFAPVVCIDDAKEYFDCDIPLPKPCDFMLMVYQIKKRWQKKVPSVVHVDGSGRLQTIRKKDNRDYYDLIKEFGKLSGIPMLINTSFNVRGEPIVCTPYDAYRCMMGTEIDCIVMGKFLVKRCDNLKDSWDSESIYTNSD